MASTDSLIARGRAALALMVALAAVAFGTLGALFIAAALAVQPGSVSDVSGQSGRWTLVGLMLLGVAASAVAVAHRLWRGRRL